jgi:hypothetical protein
MTNDQFLFWLWGWFEINEEDPQVLDNLQLSTIVDHIKLVKEENPYASPFVYWLEGALEYANLALPNRFESEDYDKLTNLIYDRLKSEFERKAKTIGALKDNPLSTPPPIYISPSTTCAPNTSTWADINNLPPNTPVGSC